MNRWLRSPHTFTGKSGRTRRICASSRRWRLIVAAAALALAVTACSGGTGQNPSTGSGAKNANAANKGAAAKPAPPNLHLLVVANDPWGSDWSYNQFNPNFIGTAANDLALLPLAIQTPKGLTNFIPQIASSWSVKGHTLTVHLRKGASWDDGQPITSKDVLDTTLLQGVTSGGMWNDIVSVSTPTTSTVVYKLNPAVATATSEAEVLGMYVLPDQTYGQFISNDLKSTVESYYKQEQSDPTAASKSAAGKTLSALNSKVIKFKPAKLIGDGPYSVKAVTLQETDLVKNPHFYNANKVTVPEIIWQESSTSTNEGELLSGTADFSWTGLSGDVYQKELQTSGMHIQAPPNFADYAFYFNCRKYPLNMTKVRQAIAYVIHRPALLSLQAGKHNYDSYVQYPSLEYNAIQDLYVTKAQRHTLNPYKYNPAKAASLLQSAGFTKKGKDWYMPNGKQFTLTIDAPAGWEGVESLPIPVAGWLTDFGIKTVGKAVEQPGFWTFQQDGQFDIDWGWGGWTSNPLQRYDDVIGSPLNFTSGGAYKGKPGIGFGPVMTVPGLGKVNIPQTLDKQAATVGPGPKMKKLVWIWTKFVNQQLPVMMFGDKNIPLQYNTTRFAWPSSNSSLWDLMGYNVEGGLAVMLEKGATHPQ